MYIVKLQRKANGKLVSPRKEINEQFRLRNNYERKIFTKLVSTFKKIGREASDGIQSGQRFPASLETIQPKISDLLINHYRQVIRAFGQRTLDMYVQKKAESFTDFEFIIQRYLRFDGGTKITGISETTRNQIVNIIRKGMTEGVGVAPIAKNIRDFMGGSFTRYRSQMIARTETHSASIFANHEVTKKQDIPDMQKRWIATNDGRTRTHHSLLNGKTVGRDEDFVFNIGLNRYAMQHPADPRGGAINNINCRCVLAYVVPEDGVVEETVTIEDAPATKVTAVNVSQLETGISRKDFFDTTINNAVNEDTIRIIPKAQAVKEIKKILQEASNDVRYLNKKTSHFSGRKPEMFGDIDASGLGDRELSMVLALMPELQALAKKFGIPMIRGIKSSKNKKAFNANMGDGIMGLQINYTKRRASGIGRLKREPTADEKSKIALIENEIKEQQQETDKLLKKYDSFTVNEMYKKINFYDNSQRADYRRAYDLYFSIKKRQEDLQDIKFSLGNTKLDVNPWKYGDDISKRPHSVSDFEDNHLERFRSTFYHEMGHLVHQQYKLTASRLGKERISQGKEPYYYQVERPLEDRLSRVRNIKKTSPSTYGSTNTKEWFVENFSAYFRGRKDYVAPEFLEILQEIFDDKIL